MFGVKCPYCGGEMKHRTEKVVDWAEVYRHNLKCECGATSPYADNLINAVKMAGLRPAKKPMTCSEVITLDVAWLEDIDKQEVIPAFPTLIYDRNMMFFKSANTDIITAKRGEYGIRWRAWASRPTDEERDAAPWEVQE